MDVETLTGNDGRSVLRIYMMQQALEYVSLSQYRDSFIIKCGIVVTSVIAIAILLLK